MRSPCRLLMAAILLVSAAGVARAQEPDPAPPAAAPEVAKPVAELPPIPVAEPSAPAVEPALTADQSAPAAEPAPATLDAPAEEKQVTTTTRSVTKKTRVARKPAEKPVIEKPVIEAIKPPEAAAGVAAIDTTGNAPPPNAAASAVPPESVVPAPPAARAAVVETPATEAEPQKKLGIGSWILFGLGLIAVGGIATRFLRRRLRSPTSIVDFTSIHPEAKPILVTRP